jgi:hypothetical protein
MKSLADKLRELESEVLAEHGPSHPVLAELSAMIKDLEIGTATYRVDCGEVVRVPNESL